MWTTDVFEQLASEMAMSDAVNGKINEKLGVNASTSSFNKPLNLPNNVAPFLERNPEYSHFFNSGMPKTLPVQSGNLSPYYEIPQTGLGEGYVRDPTYIPKSPSYVVSWEKPQTDLPFNLGEIEHPYSKYFGKTVNSNNPLEWHPSSFNEPKINPFFNVKSIANPALGTLAGLAALDEAINGKNPTALGMLIPNSMGMGLGSLLYSTPLNEGEDEMMAAINAGSNLPFKGSIAAATNGTNIAVDPNAAKQYADSIASSLNPKPPVNPNDLLNEAIKYRKLNNAIRRGAPLIEPQEEAQMVVQGAPEVKPENDMEVAPLDETPVRKSAGESTTSQPKNYITNGTKTTTFDKDKSLTKTSTSNPPANATTVPAPSKKNSSVTARQSNATKQAQTSRTAQPVRNRTSRAPVQQRRVSPTLAEAIIYNRPDTLPVQTPVTRPNTNASGYTKGHEAVFNPRTGRLEFI